MTLNMLYDVHPLFQLQQDAVLMRIALEQQIHAQMGHVRVEQMMYV